ncbi:alkaline protease [Myriangium duriaei CBS 260.36]|uniref:Alkaline protease n=1 Tax=Myriangium duriaei CBS 260.36 TaxID=1168546 RepID=A0A9P4ITR2_9PEZI|nr:alkaline protease [Myriangium duriaei CBS 260.36]
MFILLTGFFAGATVFVEGSELTDLTDRYIITLKPGSYLAEHLSVIHHLHTQAAFENTDNTTFEGVTHQYELPEFQAYAGHFHRLVIQQVKHFQDVAAVEEDRLYHAGAMVRQRDAGYGLDVISHRSAWNENRGVYVYDRSAGLGTFAYVVDSGIQTRHNDFGGRASLGYNACKSKPFRDDNGHGTHIAGIIGSATYGVAKRCQLIAVKVLTRNYGPASTLLDGYQWAVNDILNRHRQASAIINVSIWGPYSTAWNRAVDMAFRRGVSTVVCAGNDDIDAHHASPASANGAITVGATTAYRKRWQRSNFGRDVNIFAPGVSILSTTTGGMQATERQSGTSQASAYVAGLVLYFKALKHLPSARSTRHYLMAQAVPGIVTDRKGSDNKFAYNGNGL